MKRVTLKDIAKRTGVSIATVSKVINQNDNKAARPETVEAIEHVARELGYRRPSSAKTATLELGVLVMPEKINLYSHPYFSDMVAGINEAATELRMSVAFVVTAEELQTNEILCGQVMNSGIPNLIALGDNYYEYLQEIKSRFRNVVSMLSYTPEQWVTDVVVSDTYTAARQAIEQLLESGRRRLLFLGPTLRPNYRTLSHREVEGRARAYADVLTEWGLVVDPSLMYDCDFSPEKAYEMTDRLLRERRIGFDAVVAGDDMMAMAALKALNEHNIDIPEQVAVVGFNNQEFCNYSFPPLSTVDLNARTQGKVAVQMLWGKHHLHIHSPLQISVPSKFIRRDSCGSLPTGSAQS